MKWEYMSAAAEKTEAVFEAMEEYIRKNQNTVAHYIATQSLLDLCEPKERTPGERVGIRWWEQGGIELIGARETAAVVAESEENGMEYL